MPSFSLKQYAIALTALILLALAGFVLWGRKPALPPSTPPAPMATTTAPAGPSHHSIGHSVNGRSIEEYTFGEGKTHLLFVGGMHGGYEWNSVVLAYDFIDFLNDPINVPDGFTISVIPSANPDGVYDVVGKVGRFTSADVPDVSKKPIGYGRLNAHSVDLNRNFACNWKPKSMWRGNEVSAGKSAFSEPEAVAIHDAVASDTPVAVIFWHSQSGSVYASQCNKGILPDTLAIMNVYAKAAGYNPIKKFDAYAITGDSEGWLASISIPAITVELQTHNTIEWERNLLGFKALIDYYRSNGK